MKKQITFLTILLFFAINTFSQLTLQYRACSDCDANDPVINWEAVDIASDFGMRTTGSIWHRGVDFGKPGSIDYGYHLISPVDGTVEKFYISSISPYYKILAIRSNSNNYHLGYGHIFNNSDPDIGSPLVKDDFVLYKFSYLGIRYYAIINTLTNVAISEIDGYSFTYNGHPYITTNQVTAGQEIAPLGGSGGFMGGLQHLHLYRFVNPSATSISSIQNKDNCKDPLQILNIINTNYEFEIETNNITEAGSNIFYSGANKSVVKVKCSMINPGQNSTSTHYSTAIMDIDDVDLIIKKVSEPTSAFHLIHGVNYLSKISHGARWSGSPYPNTAPDQIREHYGVYSSNTNNCKIGIIPSAYSSHPWDEFVFTDIYTRIHKDHNLNGTLTLANNPDEALYPDGEYNLAVQITTVKGQQQDNFNTPTEILIDNFYPFVKKVEVSKNSDYTDLVYKGEWTVASGTNNYHIVKDYDDYALAGYQYYVKVTTSEDCKDVTLSIPELNFTSIAQNGTLPEQLYGSTEHLFIIPYSAFSSYSEASGNLTLEIKGKDMADNNIEELNTNNVPNESIYTNPIRTSSTAWSEAPFNTSANAKDTYHSFPLGCPAYRALTNSPCIQAEFSYEVTTSQAGSHTVQFTNLSDGASIFSWDFGYNGQVSTVENPSMNYPAGEYTVSLTASDAEGNSHTRTKQVIIQPDYALNINFTDVSVSSDNLYINGEAFTQEGEIIEVKVSKDELTWWNATGTTNWSRNLQWTEGDTYVYAKARNNLGDWTEVISRYIGSSGDDWSNSNLFCSMSTNDIDEGQSVSFLVQGNTQGQSSKLTFEYNDGDFFENYESSSNQYQNLSHIYNYEGTYYPRAILKTYDAYGYEINEETADCGVLEVNGEQDIYNYNASISISPNVFDSSNPPTNGNYTLTANITGIPQELIPELQITWQVTKTNTGGYSIYYGQTKNRYFSAGDFQVTLVVNGFGNSATDTENFTIGVSSGNCFDCVLNGDEEGIDCGGGCTPCDMVGTYNTINLPERISNEDDWTIKATDWIKANNNYTVNSGMKRKLIATNSIELGPGFDAKVGSDFEAEINPVYCPNKICYQIPNVFTPNCDGINDDWLIAVSGAYAYELTCEDRWGAYGSWWDELWGNVTYEADYSTEGEINAGSPLVNLWKCDDYNLPSCRNWWYILTLKSHCAPDVEIEGVVNICTGTTYSVAPPISDSDINESYLNNDVVYDRSTQDNHFTVQPNPFADFCKIYVNLTEDYYTKVEVYSATGRLIKVLYDNIMPSGKNVITFKANGESNIYFVRITTPKEIENIKIIKQR